MKTTIILLLLLITLVNAWANDSLTIQVSCSIPMVPGLNAPLNEEKLIQHKESGSEESLFSTKGEIVIQEKEEKINLPNGEASLITIKTIYTR